MTLPTKIKTWNYSVNHDVTEAAVNDMCKHAVYQIKEALVSFSQWSVVASSDSSSVKNIGDASPDLWTDWNTDVVPGTGAHSWIILENSVTGAQLCFDMLAGSAYVMDVVYSATGAFNADGTTNDRPTDSESIYITDGRVWAPTSTDGMVVNAMCSSDGEITRVYAHMTDAAEKGGFFFGLESITGTPSGWDVGTVKQAVLRIDANVNLATTPSQQDPRVNQYDSTTEKIYMYLEDSTPYEGWNLAYLTTECYNQWSGDQGNALCEVNVDMDWNGGYPVTAMGLFRTTSPRQGGMGAFQDIYLGPEAHQALTSYPNDASYQWVKWGAFFVPWNGTAPVEAP